MARHKVPRSRRVVQRRDEREAARVRRPAHGPPSRAGVGEVTCNGSPETPTFTTTSTTIPTVCGKNGKDVRQPAGVGEGYPHLLSPLDTTVRGAGTGEGGWRSRGGSSSPTADVEDEVDMATIRPSSGARLSGQWPAPTDVADRDHDVDSEDSADRVYNRDARRVTRIRDDDDEALRYARPDIRVVRCPSRDDDPSAAAATPAGSRYTCVDALFNLVSIVSYLLDVGSDLFLVYVYYSKPHWWWFGLTLTFVLAPSVVMTCFSLKWYIVDHQAMKERGRNVSTCRWVSRVGFLVLQAAPVLRYIDTVVYGVRSQRVDRPTERRHWYDQMLYEDTDSALLRLFECFMEAAPQLCLQLYILTIFGPKGALYLVLAQCFGAVTSLVSMSWALCSYHRSLRLSLQAKAKMTSGGVVLQFFWHFFTIGARIVAISLFASYFRGWVFVLLGAHWCAMLVWVLIQNTHFCETKCEEFFFDVVAALVYIFCYFNLTEGHTRLRYLFYYTVVYSENAAMILVWYLFTQTLDLWYHHYALAAVLGGFFLGIGFQVAYYLRCHPNNLSGNSSRRIKVCRPLEELVAVQEDKSELEMSDMTDYSNGSRRHQAGSPASRISAGNSGYTEDSDSADCIQPLMGDIC